MDSNYLKELLKYWIAQCKNIATSYKEMKIGHAEIRIIPFEMGRLDFYFTDHICFAPFDIVSLFVDDTLFISITPFELQSQINPIKWAKGNVLVAGMGLVYYLNQIKIKDEVVHIDVVEQHPDVIELYKKQFSHHPKVTLINEDIFTFTSDYVYDFTYIDIWGNLSDDNEQDFRKIMANLQSKTSAFWGVEKYILDQFYDSNKTKDLLKIVSEQNMEWAFNDIFGLYFQFLPR